MEAKELRIGNLVYSTQTRQDIRKVVGLSMQDVQHASVFKLHTSDRYNGWLTHDEGAIDGIPLTEGWLLMFGFEDNSGSKHFIKKIRDNFYHVVGWRHDMDTKSWLTMSIYDRGKWEQTFTVLDYVHQLQNLYFALTGKELEIKKAR